MVNDTCVPHQLACAMSHNSTYHGVNLTPARWTENNTSGASLGSGSIQRYALNDCKCLKCVLRDVLPQSTIVILRLSVTLNNIECQALQDNLK